MRPVLTVLRSEPDYPPDMGVIMEFRLTYEGPLLGDKHPRPEHKHEIRRKLHKQLAQLWDIHPLLKRRSSCMVKVAGEVKPGLPSSDEILNKHMGGRARVTYSGTDVGFTQTFPGTEWHSVGNLSLRDYLAEKYTINNFRFVPLVREQLSLVTSLHVLFLRPGRPGAVINSGDLDGRIKTLFDALQVPKVGQLKADQKPGDGETPFYCLVEDDQYITGLAVETDMLLEPTGKSEGHPENDVRLVITVKLHPYEHHPGNEGF